MPYSAPRPCNYRGQPRCGAVVTGDARLCPTHLKEVRRISDKKRNSNPDKLKYGRKQWRALRTQVLQAEPLCRECTKHGRTTAAREVDHIISIANGGTDEIENLQPLCTPCHSTKTALENRGFGNKVPSNE